MAPDQIAERRPPDPQARRPSIPEYVLGGDVPYEPAGLRTAAGTAERCCVNDPL
jgi:hypothetical protein